MNKWIIAVIATVIATTQLHADAGMWVTKDILQNISDMRKAGLKLSASDIYSVNKVSLKDAVVGLSNEDYDFDSFASASFVSDRGLVITNYHPVIGHLERFSNAERDFLKFGYWSTKPEEESYCRGLQVIQLVKMEDVTEAVLKGTEGMSPGDKTNKINENGRSLVVQQTRGTKTSGRITSFMGGNQYILSIYKVYKDVRMVAAPPMALGKFGGDADNWAWPRHTADFSLLRVYVDQNNEPAVYSKENKPLSGNPYLKISIAGVQENDFAMTMGYPGRSKLYIPSFAIEYMEKTELPARLKIRSEKLRIINEGLAQRPEIKYRYTSRINSLTNSYLRWKGELNGLKKMQLTTQKEADEKALTAWIVADSKRTETFGRLMETQRDIYQKLIPYKTADLYFNEACLNGADVVPFSGKFEKLVQMFNRKNLNQSAIESELGRLRPLADQFYKDWDYTIDLEMYRNMFYLYYQNVGEQFKTPAMFDALKKFDGDVDAYARWAFGNSIITSPEKMKNFLAKVDTTTIETLTSDPVYELSISFYKVYTERVGNQMKKLENDQAFYYNLYMEALAGKNKGQKYAPDANRTQRLSYGKVTGCTPVDGLRYNYYTTLEGLFEKNNENPGHPDYHIPAKIRSLHSAADFGKYATGGSVRVNFLTNNHTTSASSGSPVLNKRGELIGLNFDRIAEGVASDYQFLPELSRSIVVDIRYVLFILEKYSPSAHLLREMTITEKK
jgi:hypothetical protein